MFPSCRWIVAALVLGTALTGATLAAPPEMAGAVAPAYRCATSQLGASAVRSSGAAGHLALLFRLHNRSTTACTLFGFPGIQLVDGKVHNMATHAIWASRLFGSRKPHLVILPPGGNAYFALYWGHIPSGNQPCPMAHGFRIIPPNAYNSILAFGGMNAADPCGGVLYVSAVEETPLSI